MDNAKALTIDELDVGVVKLTLTGELDFGTLPAIREEACRSLDKRPSHVMIDLRPLTFIDSSGLGFLLSLYKKAQSIGRRVVLLSVSPQINKLLKVSCLDTIMDIFADPEQALQQFAQHSPSSP